MTLDERIKDEVFVADRRDHSAELEWSVWLAPT